MEEEVAWPPTKDSRSMRVTLNFEGWFARVAAQDIPAAPPPTMRIFFGGMRTAKRDRKECSAR